MKLPPKEFMDDMQRLNQPLPPTGKGWKELTEWKLKIWKLGYNSAVKKNNKQISETYPLPIK
jgi:hypothetical protein